MSIALVDIAASGRSAFAATVFAVSVARGCANRTPVALCATPPPGTEVTRFAYLAVGNMRTVLTCWASVIVVQRAVATLALTRDDTTAVTAACMMWVRNTNRSEAGTVATLNRCQRVSEPLTERAVAWNTARDCRARVVIARVVTARVRFQTTQSVHRSW